MTRTCTAFAALAVLFAANVAVAGPSSASKELKKRESLLAVLEDARKKALDVIFDVNAYPDEDHGRAGQAAVDEKVEKVRQAFAAVEPLLAADAVKVAKAPEAKRRAFLEMADADLSRWEVAVRKRYLDNETLRKNEQVGRGRLERGVAPTDSEREQARLTNEYRMLMGRRALEIDPRLVACARDHSKEMVRLRYFAHESPTPGRRRPSDRCALAGVSGVATGENICYGYENAKRAFDGWYRSSGHHRNVLDAEWATIGVGREGEHWTQNFAGAASSSSR